METWGKSLNWYLVIVLFLVVANMNNKKNIIAYCPPKMINQISKEKMWFLKTLWLKIVYLETMPGSKKKEWRN